MAPPSTTTQHQVCFLIGNVLFLTIMHFSLPRYAMEQSIKAMRDAWRGDDGSRVITDDIEIMELETKAYVEQRPCARERERQTDRQTNRDP